MREADLANNAADRALTLFNRATRRWLVPGYEQGNEATIELACGARLCGAAAIVAAWSSEERERELLSNLLGYAWPLPQRRWAVGQLVERAKGRPNGAEQLPRALELVDHRFSALSLENALIGLDHRSPTAWLISHAGAFDTVQADSPSSEQISQEAGRLRHASKMEGTELVAATHVLHVRLGIVRTIADVLVDSAHADGDQVRPSVGESIWTAAAIGAAAVLAAIGGDERFLSKLWTMTLPAEERLGILTKFLKKASDAKQEMSILLAVDPEIERLERRVGEPVLDYATRAGVAGLLGLSCRPKESMARAKQRARKRIQSGRIPESRAKEPVPHKTTRRK